MARVTAPLFSLAAHGTYRGELVFRQRGQISTVSKPPTITASRSAGQLTTQSNVADMQAEWALTDAPTKSAWAVYAATIGLNKYTAYWQQWFIQGSSPGNPPSVPA